MSHFSVLVVGSNVDTQLEPYQENNMGDCPAKYLAFFDREDELLEEFETGSSRRVVMPDGTYKYPWDEEFRVEGSGGFGGNTHEVPAHLEQREVPFKELYASLEEFAKDYHGYESRDAKSGRYGYWENPNRKWDWYVVGGRWSGFFKLKSAAPTENPRADHALKGDIDIEGMRAEAEALATAQYDTFHAIVDAHGFRTFDEISQVYPDNADSARAVYWSQPACAALREANISPFVFAELAAASRDEYLAQARNGALATFAVLKDGVWYERGKMGWFGFSDDHMAKEDWDVQYNAMLDALPPDTPLTVVDCHI